MRRTLGSLERAAARTYAAAPFHAAVSVDLDGALDSEGVRRALSRIVGRQPHLSAYVVKGRFERCEAAEPEFVAARSAGGDEDEDARAIDELLADRPRERGAHPVRARFIEHDRGTTLIIAAPHYLVDGVSLAQIVSAMLTEEAGETTVDAPAIERRFPPRYRGMRVLPKLAQYVFRQMADEARLRFDRRGTTSLPAPPDGRTRHEMRSFDAQAIGTLLSGCRRHRCTLSGILAAVALRVFLAVLAKRDSGVLGLLSFRDLRRRAQPAYSADEFGACFSMFRNLIKVEHDSDWQIATGVSRTLAMSGRRGEPFLANFIAPYLLALALPMRTRLADVAISLSRVDWHPKLFASRVRRLAGFVSTMPFAPPISIVAALSPAGLSLSFLYLDSEFDGGKAKSIADAVASRLSDAIERVR